MLRLIIAHYTVYILWGVNKLKLLPILEQALSIGSVFRLRRPRKSFVRIRFLAHY